MTPELCEYWLRAALRHPLLNIFSEEAIGRETTKEERKAAFAACAYLGACRLGKLTLTGDIAALNGSVLFPSLAQAAAQDAIRIARGHVGLLPSLQERIDASANQTEVNQHVTSVMHWRQQADQAMRAIRESYQDWLDSPGVAAADFKKTMDELLDALDELDRAMREHLDAITLILDTDWITDTRALFAEGEPLPWWLDGTLQERAAELRKKHLRSLPTEGWWAKMREGG